MIRVTENLALINDLLALAAVEANRGPTSIRLLAVSKKQPVEKILAAAAAGQVDFGENFVQEGLAKMARTRSENLIWHFIGHLQTNKTRVVAENFDWIHTIDNAKTARRLSDQRPAALGALNVCLQVNVDNEEGKSTILAALQTVLFEKHNVTGAVANAMLPYGSKVRPEITLEFDHDGARYRLHKAFHQRPAAELDADSGGRWTGDAAEERLREMLEFTPPGKGGSKPEHRGLQALFWVEQGKARHTCSRT